MLKAKEKHRGFPDIVQSHDVTPPPKLEEIGISRKQSSRWQAIADILCLLSRWQGRIKKSETGKSLRLSPASDHTLEVTSIWLTFM